MIKALFFEKRYSILLSQRLSNLNRNIAYNGFCSPQVNFFSSIQSNKEEKKRNEKKNEKLNSSQHEIYSNLFRSIGLEEKLVNNTISNPKLTQSLADLCNSMNIKECDKKKGILLYNLCSKLSPSIAHQKNLLAEFVICDKIATSHQLDRALECVKLQKLGISREEVENQIIKYCGIGLNFSEDEVLIRIQQYVKLKQAEFIQKGRNFNTASYLKELRDMMPSANGSLIFTKFKEEIDLIFKSNDALGKDKEESFENERRFQKAKIFNVVARDMTSSVNPPDILESHLRETEGKIITRFPPEPNGYLHLGHAKAMRFSFLSAKENGGLCNLRYDDTNPLTESKEFIDNIEENVRWLGYDPAKITHASDYFEKIYNFAIDLIKKGKAYVCEQTQEEMQKYRKEKLASPYQNRPIEENLDLFQKMRDGKFKEGTYCLRLKIDYKNENPTLRDPVAYRIKEHPHPMTGEKWCIYPTYDFTHCISDSIENITHSLCSLEFEIRRDLYYWILENLELYRPMVWEFSRLNISRTVLSKRKLAQLISLGIVRGWDDPRLLTINGMKRRGFTPEGINAFCDDISVTRRGNENTISIKHLEFFIRKDLDKTSPRTMVVLQPLKVKLINLEDNFSKQITTYSHPRNKSESNTVKVEFTKEIYIEETDFRENDHPNFFGLSLNKIVGLRYGDFIKCVEIKKKPDGSIEEILAELIIPKSEKELEELKKVKGHIHWISKEDVHLAKARLFDYLFTIENPNEVDDFLSVVNRNSVIDVKGIMFNKRILHNIKIGSKFQFERLGYFCVDPDSDLQKGDIVFNRTLELNDKDKLKALSS